MRKFVLQLVILFSTCYINAQVKYVAPNGNNTNNGSALQPWQTIQYAMDNAASGDTVFIAAGNYNEALECNIDGTSSGWITFRGVSNDSVFVDGTGLNADNLLLLDDSRFIVIENIHFTNNIHNYSAGILIQNGSNDIVVRQCKISEIHFAASPSAPVNSNKNCNPLLVLGDKPNIPTANILITENEIFNCRTGFSEGLTVDGYVDGFEISKNHVHHISNIGIDMAGHYGVCSVAANDQPRNGKCFGNLVHHCYSAYADAAGIYVDGARDLVIEQNEVHHCQYGVEVGCETQGKTTSNVIVRNNFIYLNQTTGIAFGGYDFPSGSGKITNCKFYNNTCFYNDTEFNGNGELAITRAENCEMKNNIFFAHEQNKLMYCESGQAQNNVFDYNCWYITDSANAASFTYGSTDYSSYAAYLSVTNQDSHSLFYNPDFISTDTAAPDLHLQPGSVCVNAGDTSASSFFGIEDFDGNPRVLNGRIDIGATEVLATAVFNQQTSAQNAVAIFPNPAGNFFVIKNNTPELQPLFFYLYDVSGKDLFSINVLEPETEVDVRHLTPGVFFWKTNANGKCTGNGKICLH